MGLKGWLCLLVSAAGSHDAGSGERGAPKCIAYWGTWLALLHRFWNRGVNWVCWSSDTGAVS